MIVLIPCKNLDHGKSRLAACLSPRARRALCEFFLCRTLDVVTRAIPSGHIFVVTDDARAAAIAAEYGAAAARDGGAGLNEALARGRGHAIAEAGKCSGLIVPIDLPLATPDALARMIDAPHAIVPDEGGQGTNVLHLGRDTFGSFRFDFGPRSLAAHRNNAQQMGADLQIVKEPLLAFDVDTPEQYRRWIKVTGRSL
jgi:2-phospho-L-lactate/phosphoenolpyruvate guanylyltransferase